MRNFCLRAETVRGYALRAPAKSGVGIGVLEFVRAHNTRNACFFVPYSYTRSMVGCVGASKDAPGALTTGYANPAQSTTHKIGVFGGGISNSSSEAANMATTPTHNHPEFIWRFFSCQQFRYFTVTAHSEREARSQLPDSPCLFAARLPVQEVRHA